VRRENPPGDEDRRERDQLAAEHDPVHVDRRLPGDRAVFDDPRAAGSRLQTEAGSLSFRFASLFPHASSGTTADGRCGDDREPVLLVWVPVDALDVDRVARAGDQFLNFHDTSFGPESGPTGLRTASAESTIFVRGRGSRTGSRTRFVNFDFAEDNLTEQLRTTTVEAKRVGDAIGVDWTRFDLEQFRAGMDVEFEHGTHD
jgi:hypothetical protein